MATIAFQDAGVQVRPMTSLEQQRHEDFVWAMANYDELDRRYRAAYVLVWKKGVIAHGANPEELLREAVTPERPREELVLIALPDPFLDTPR
jgi:hypothetical protein